MKASHVFTIFLLMAVSFTIGSAQTVSKTVMQTEWTAAYLEFRDETYRSFKERSDKVEAEFKLSDYDRWDFRQDTGQLIFSEKGVNKVAATVQVAGSWSAKNTWMWGWNNDSIDPSLKSEMFKVREFGNKRNFYELVTPEFTIDQDYAWTLTAIAGSLIKAKSAYRGRNGTGYVYFLITDIKWLR
jgi:hypothetical protein